MVQFSSSSFHKQHESKKQKRKILVVLIAIETRRAAIMDRSEFLEILHRLSF